MSARSSATVCEAQHQPPIPRVFLRTSATRLGPFATPPRRPREHGGSHTRRSCLRYGPRGLLLAFRQELEEQFGAVAVRFHGAEFDNAEKIGVAVVGDGVVQLLLVGCFDQLVHRLRGEGVVARQPFIVASVTHRDPSRGRTGAETPVRRDRRWPAGRSPTDRASPGEDSLLPAHTRCRGHDASTGGPGP